MIIKNAKIFTSDKEKLQATALAVKDGKFVYVGDEASFKRKTTLCMDVSLQLTCLYISASHSQACSTHPHICLVYSPDII